MEMTDENVAKFVNIGNANNVDAWDVLGNSAYHYDVARQEFVDRLLVSLPVVKYPIEVGWTGYIRLTDTITLPSYGRTTDIFERNVFIIGRMLVFQRYVFGNTYVCQMIQSDGKSLGGVDSVKLNELETFATTMVTTA